MTRIALALTIVLATAHMVLFRPIDLLFSEIGIDILRMIPAIYRERTSLSLFLLRILLAVLAALCTSILIVWALKIRQVAPSLVIYRRWLNVGLAGVLVYLLAVPATFILSAVPYGGGQVPRTVHLILFVSWICLAYGLFRTLGRELPAVRGSLAKP